MPNAATRNRLQSRAKPSPSMQAEEELGRKEQGEQWGDEPRVPTRNYKIDGLVFPVTILWFNHINTQDPDHAVVRFEDANELVAYMANSMSASRVMTGKSKDLVDVPMPTLLALYNRTRGDSPLDRFRDRKSAENRTAEVVMDLAVKYQETDMAKAQAAATGQTATDAKAAEKKAEREKKAAEKKAEKEQQAKDRAERRANGVIGTIKGFLESKTGGSQAEILDSLVAKFPDRTRDGMSSTVKIQVSRLAKTTSREISSKEIQGRGRVYKFVDAGPIPGKEVVKEAPKPEPAAPRAAAKNGGKGKAAAATA